MKFDIDNKIELNKERLKYDHDNIRNLQNAYGYVVVYITFIGLTFFDFIKYLKAFDFNNIKNKEVLFLLFFIISIIFIAITLFMILSCLYQKKLHMIIYLLIFINICIEKLKNGQLKIKRIQNMKLKKHI